MAIQAADHKSCAVYQETLDLGPMIKDMSDEQVAAIAKKMAGLLIDQASPLLDLDMTIQIDGIEVNAIAKLLDVARTLFTTEIGQDRNLGSLSLLAKGLFPEYTFQEVLEACPELQTAIASKLSPDFGMKLSFEQSGSGLMVNIFIKHGAQSAIKQFALKDL
ncbi:MAG: hypothetical protein K1X28_10710 [Parachlamydiales bacterium]|nr:hypothetical protein [Parachlamydiales bacterium]